MHTVFLLADRAPIIPNPPVPFVGIALCLINPDTRALGLCFPCTLL